MVAYIKRRETGKWDGGYVKAVKRQTDHDFTNYTNKIVVTPTTKANRRYFDINSNVYGSGAYNGPRLEVDVEKYYYTFGASTYTYQLSYNNRTASGHMGIRQYDQWGNLAYFYMCGDYGPTTLSRQANPGDTTIYISNNSGWYTGTSTNSDLAVFFPASHPNYSTPYFYSRLVARYQGPTLAATGSGDYSMTLDNPLPNWGYSLPAGTPIGNGRGTNSNWYIITGNTDHDNLNKWRTFKSSVYHEFRYNGGSFINGVKYVSFLHLRNYRYRSEQAGDSARYYIANIMAIARPKNRTLPTRLFQRGLPGPFY